MPFRLSAALAAALLLAPAAPFLCAGAAHAAPFTDAAGRRVVLPEQVHRVLPADRNAEVMVYVLAPDKLAGLERAGRVASLPRDRLPALAWRPRSDPAGMAATARRLGADLIVDAGPATPERAAYADAVQRQSGIPYILIDDSFARMPSVVRGMGAILGVPDRASDIAIFAEHAIDELRGRLLIRPADSRPRLYYGLGRDGLVTPLPGSPANRSLSEAGAVNVAAALGRGGDATISRAQLLGWDPEIIIAERRSFYDSLRRDPAWRRLSAVRDHHVYLEPTDPFGWIEDPAGINRLIGLYWLSSLFYPAATQTELRTTTCDFYDRFYRIKLTNAQLESLVVPAGAPPLSAPRQAPEPLVGLGAAPPSSLPPGSPGSLTTPTPIPGIESTAPNATCAVPTGPNPQPITMPTAPGVSPYIEPVPTVPGVPPPAGRRRQPTPATIPSVPPPH